MEFNVVSMEKIMKLILALSVIGLTLGHVTQANVMAQVQSERNGLSEVSVEAYTDLSNFNFSNVLDYPEYLTNLPDQLIATEYIAVDTESKRILASKLGSELYPLASMSKIFIAYLVYKAIDEGKITMDDQVSVSDDIVTYLSQNTELSSAKLQYGAMYSVRDLLFATMLPSGNDAASALIAYLYGSEQEGVRAIRQLIEEWGIEEYEFYTVSGLPLNLLPESMRIEDAPNVDSENKMSAADFALVTDHIVNAYPKILEISSTMMYTTLSGDIYYNTNKLLPGGEYGREGMTGLKSGTGAKALQNFVSVGSVNGRQQIMVMMGVPHEIDRYSQVATLYDAVNAYPNLFELSQLPSYYRKTVAELALESISRSESNSISASQSASESESLAFRESLVEEKQQQERTRQRYMMIVMVVSVILLILSVMYYLVRKRRLEKERRRNHYLATRRRRRQK